MYVDHVETWESLLSSLIEHGTVSTRPSSYTDPQKFLAHFREAMSESKLFQQQRNSTFTYVGTDGMHRDPTGSPYFVIQMVTKFTTNKQAKTLLDQDY